MPEMLSRQSFLLLVAILQAVRKLPLQALCGYDLSTCIVDRATLSLETSPAATIAMPIHSMPVGISASTGIANSVALAGTAAASPAEGVGPRILAEMENRMTAKKPGPKPWKAAWSSTVVAAEMALSVLAYNLTQVMNIVGINPLIVAIAA